ncbi:hypothetical protein [Luteitalea sp.]|jgi:hypothetical protein|uniref:hypothetical protein n=1 Tax=Luteitalea sp. TaxID=2004800 RepID=UPI0037CB8A8A
MTLASAAFLPPGDAFGRSATLDFGLHAPVLGMPLRIRSNAEQALRHAEVDFGVWRTLPSGLVGDGPVATFDIVVHPRTAEALGPLTYRRHGAVFMAAAGTVMVSVLPELAHAVAFVPAHALEDGEWFRSHVTGLAWMLASRHRRVPLHAAAVVGDARALLLLAESGGGKSTLAYACGHAGLRVLTEDTVFVDAAGSVARLWGGLPCHWLRPAAVDMFPELAGHPVVVRGNGKPRLRIPAAGPPLLTTTAPVSAVLIETGGDEPVLEALGSDVLADRVAADRTEGFDQYPESRPGVVDWLRTRPAYLCRRGPDPRLTARLLARLAAAPSESPASMRLPMSTTLTTTIP